MAAAGFGHRQPARSGVPRGMGGGPPAGEARRVSQLAPAAGPGTRAAATAYPCRRPRSCFCRQPAGHRRGVTGSFFRVISGRTANLLRSPSHPRPRLVGNGGGINHSAASVFSVNAWCTPNIMNGVKVVGIDGICCGNSRFKAAQIRDGLSNTIQHAERADGDPTAVAVRAWSSRLDPNYDTAVHFHGPVRLPR